LTAIVIRTLLLFVNERKLFAKIKAWPRKAAARTLDTLIAAIADALAKSPSTVKTL
jgi:hypothetical protein